MWGHISALGKTVDFFFSHSSSAEDASKSKSYLSTVVRTVFSFHLFHPCLCSPPTLVILLLNKKNAICDSCFFFSEVENVLCDIS